MILKFRHVFYRLINLSLLLFNLFFTNIFCSCLPRTFLILIHSSFRNIVPAILFPLLGENEPIIITETTPLWPKKLSWNFRKNNCFLNSPSYKIFKLSLSILCLSFYFSLFLANISFYSRRKFTFSYISIYTILKTKVSIFCEYLARKNYFLLNFFL